MKVINLGRVVGEDGRGIEKIEKTATVGLIDTYTITYTDGSTSTYEVKNGANASGEGGTSDYTALENLPSINGVTLLGNKTTEDLGIENYDDTEIKDELKNKADKTELHNHTNKEILDNITQENIDNWNNRTSVSGLTTPQIQALEGLFKVCAYIKEDVSAEYDAFVDAFYKNNTGDGGHTHNYREEVITPVTCTQDGLAKYTCSCGSIYTDTIPATGHVVVDKACQICGAYVFTGSDFVQGAFGQRNYNSGYLNPSTNNRCSIIGLDLPVSQHAGKNLKASIEGVSETLEIACGFVLQEHIELYGKQSLENLTLEPGWIFDDVYKLPENVAYMWITTRKPNNTPLTPEEIKSATIEFIGEGSAGGETGGGDNTGDDNTGGDNTGGEEEPTTRLSYTLTSDNFTQGALYDPTTNNLPSYTTNYIYSFNTTRCSYAGLDYSITGDTVIKATATSTSGETLLVGIQSINNDAAQAYGTQNISLIFATGGELPSSGRYAKESGWLESGTIYTIPTNAEYMFICIKKSDNTEITPDEIASVVIEEVV